MSTPTIADFLFDDDNEEKITSHGLTVRQVRQVLDNRHVIAANRKSRRGLYLVIGRDHGGAAITMPVEPTHGGSLAADHRVAVENARGRTAALIARGSGSRKRGEDDGRASAAGPGRVGL